MRISDWSSDVCSSDLQALYAVAMKGATARKAIARSARDADMADFRMHGAVHGMAVEREPSAHAGSDGDIAQAVGWRLPPRARAPAQLRQGGPVDVGVDHRGTVEGRGQRAEYVRARPAGLGRRQHDAETGRAAIEPNRAEAADPDRRDRSLRMPAVPHRHRSEEHTSELQSLMRISYAVFCLKKKHTQ